MFCCPNCFTHTFLRNEIKTKSHQIGICSFCTKKGRVPLVKPDELLDLFQPIFDLYRPLENGISLNKILHDEWLIFSKWINAEKQLFLLSQIVNDPSISEKKFSSSVLSNQEIINQWKLFSNELIDKNRFFPENAIAPNHLSELFKYLVVGKKYLPNIVYRARINSADTPFDITQMGKPPSNESKDGRANPKGISYFYAASNPKTAITEIRPNKNECVSVATFKIKKDVFLVDLRNPKRTISPFGLDDDELMLIFKHIPFLIHLCDSLSMPVLPGNAELNYLPTQYLCELIKVNKINGIVFKSSLEKGDNYVFFDESFLTGIKVEKFLVSEIAVKTKKYL